MRAYTTANQTIDLSVSIDGWPYTLTRMFNSTNPKAYHDVKDNFECYEIQFKIELKTNNENATPVLYDFTFDVKNG
jgi:hypothetical protein